MKFSREAVSWFEELGNSNIWFAQDYGMPFLSELRGTWNEVLISSSEPIIQDYFVNQGLLKDKLPRVKVFESYPGSWIIDAAIVMLASVGTAYTILKGISELPKIADGLNELKERLKKGFSQLSSKSARDHLEYHVKQHHLPKPPAKLIENDFTIDVRPLLSLTPSLMKSHRVHLNAAISRDAFTLENLGEELMRDIRIGIFKSTSQRNQWCYVDSYMGSVDILSQADYYKGHN